MAPACRNRTASRSASAAGISESVRPLDMKTGIPPSDGSGSGTIGTMARNRIAPASVPGSRRSVLAAMLAPLENPTATMPVGSNP